MSELNPISFMQYILKDRITVNGRIIPVIIKLKERIDTPFVTFHLTHNKQLPYYLTSFEVLRDEGKVRRHVIRLHEYTIDTLVYASNVRERDEILQQIVELTRRAQRNHYTFCRNLEGETCKTTGRECDARRIYSADSPFAHCPYWDVKDPDDPHFRGPTSPLKDFDIFFVRLGRWDHDLDADHKPPVYLARQEVIVTTEEKDADKTALYTSPRLAKC